MFVNNLSPIGDDSCPAVYSIEAHQMFVVYRLHSVEQAVELKRIATLT